MLFQIWSFALFGSSSSRNVAWTVWQFRQRVHYVTRLDQISSIPWNNWSRTKGGREKGSVL